MCNEAYSFLVSVFACVFICMCLSESKRRMQSAKHVPKQRMKEIKVRKRGKKNKQKGELKGEVLRKGWGVQGI